MGYSPWHGKESDTTKRLSKQAESLTETSQYKKAAAATAESIQLYPTLCDPIDGSPPSSPVPGILYTTMCEIDS